MESGLKIQPNVIDHIYREVFDDSGPIRAEVVLPEEDLKMRLVPLEKLQGLVEARDDVAMCWSFLSAIAGAILSNPTLFFGNSVVVGVTIVFLMLILLMYVRARRRVNALWKSIFV